MHQSAPIKLNINDFLFDITRKLVFPSSHFSGVAAAKESSSFSVLMEWQDRFSHGIQCQLKHKRFGLGENKCGIYIKTYDSASSTSNRLKEWCMLSYTLNTCKWTCVPYPPPPYTRIVSTNWPVAVRQIESSSKQLDTSSEDEAVLLSSSPPSSIHGGRITFPRYLVQ